MLKSEGFIAITLMADKSEQNHWMGNHFPNSDLPNII